MFHSEIFSSSIASGATTRAQVNYVSAGATLPPIVNGMQVSQSLNKVGLIAGVGANMVQVQIQAPSQTPFPYTNFNPNNRGTAFESPPRVWDFFRAPLEFRPTEELDIFASQNSGAGQTQYVMVTMTDGIPTPIGVTINPPGYSINQTSPGRYFQAHWTASTTLSAAAWTQVTPSFDTALPAGYYALVGARSFSATGLFFRIKQSMSSLWKPGGIAVQTYDQLDPVGQRYFETGYPQPGSWGVWCFFYQNVPPFVEFFATAGDTAEEGWFDLIYIGPQISGPAL